MKIASGAGRTKRAVWRQQKVEKHAGWQGSSIFLQLNMKTKTKTKTKYGVKKVENEIENESEYEKGNLRK